MPAIIGAVVFLMRHAETDWQGVTERGWVGLANDFAPLSARGRRQAADAAGPAAQLRPAVLLTSPMTRAMETAAIIGRRLGLDPVVEIDLREWLPDRRLRWSSAAEVRNAYAAMIAGETVPPPDALPDWETMGELRNRGLAALRPYAGREDAVLAVCHEVIIEALTGQRHTGECEIQLLSGM